MGYTFASKHPAARVYVENARISTKNAAIVCAVIRRKPLNRVLRLLTDLEAERRSLGGKYYSNAVREIKMLIESCAKNAEFLNLESERLMVHASAHQGSSLHRRRRKSAFGSLMKTTNIEIMLMESGKLPKSVKGQKDKKKGAEKGEKKQEKTAKPGEKTNERKMEKETKHEPIAPAPAAKEEKI